MRSPQTEDGLNAQSMFAQPRKAYVLLGVEPEFDCANPVRALAALDARGARRRDVAVPARHGLRRRDPADRSVHRDRRNASSIAKGGRNRSTASSSRSARPAPRGRCCACWGRCSGCRGSSFESIDDVRTSLPTAADIAANLANDTRVEIVKPAARAAGTRARGRRSDPFRRPARAPGGGAAADRRRESRRRRG